MTRQAIRFIPTRASVFIPAVSGLNIIGIPIRA